jgi:hypothetical protein
MTKPQIFTDSLQLCACTPIALTPEPLVTAAESASWQAQRALSVVRLCGSRAGAWFEKMLYCYGRIMLGCSHGGMVIYARRIFLLF